MNIIKLFAFGVVVMAFFVTPNIAYAGNNCLSGDCENGKGKKQNSSGYVYSGYFEDGKREGFGTIHHPNGVKVFEGQFEYGKKEGEGTSYYYKTGRIKYEGDWSDNDRHGWGMSYWAKSGKKKYDGEWEDFKPHGWGTLYRPSGGISYDGEWKNGSQVN